MKARPKFSLAGRGRLGFTLIEIMVVVAIMGLTFAIGMPAFVHAFKREGMRKTEKDLLDACRQARAEAIMKNQTVDLVFHPIDRTFEVPGVFPMAQLPDDVMIDIMGVNFIQYERAEIAHVHFFPNGTSDEFTMLLHSTQGEYRKYSLDTVTALAVVETIR
jgi:prepilin-type N-terminal cleavage/methylation domain-containing protein